MAKVSKVEYTKTADIAKSAVCVVEDTKIIVPLEDLIDIKQELVRQNKKLDKLDNEFKSIVSRLNNSNFVKNAPKEVIDKTNDRKLQIENEMLLVKDIIKKLS